MDLPIQILDIVVISVVLLSALFGVIYGFFGILFSLVIWIASLVIAIQFSSTLSTSLLFIDIPFVRTVSAFVGLFICSLIILSSIMLLITKLLGKMRLTAVDRMLGFMLGLGVGTIIIETAVFACGFTELPSASWWHASQVMIPFEKTAIWAGQYLPQNIVQYHHY